jgi:hypothetical protein
MEKDKLTGKRRRKGPADSQRTTRLSRMVNE